jgi:hypothetical protein
MSVFISYRREDSQEIVGRIFDRLKSDLPRTRIFRDLDSITPGQGFRDVIREALNNSTVALVVIGPKWAVIEDEKGNRRLHHSEDLVRIEVELALQARITVIPVLISWATMPARDELPDPLRPITGLHASPVRPDPDFHRDMDRLIGSLAQKRLPGARLDGRWRLAAHYDDVGAEEFIIEFSSVGHVVTGTATCLSGTDQGRVYEIQGVFSNLIFRGTWLCTDCNTIEAGTICLMLIGNGDKLHGFNTYYHSKNRVLAVVEQNWHLEKSDARP